MALEEALLATFVGVPVYDWLSVTGSAAKMTSFDYQYLPPSRARIASILFLAGTVFFTFYVMHPPEPDSRLWLLIPPTVGITVHGVVMVLDVFRQRRLARENGEDDEAA